MKNNCKFCVGFSVDLRKLHLKRNNADILSEVSIYKLRLAEMRQLKQKEIEAGERINKATPIDINMNNCDVKAAVSALVGATLILTEHYTNMNANARYEGMILSSYVCYPIVKYSSC